MTSLLRRLDALTAALTAASPRDNGRISSDYVSTGPDSKSSGGGRRVASKAGEKRYGLPIGTPLGQTGSRKKNDAKTQASYANFTSAKTPAELNKAASWMSNDDLKRSGEALFSFQSKNERDEAARMSLIKELAARGIDPHSVGYKGGPVVVNPNPKKDPTVVAAERKQAAADKAKRERERLASKAQREAERARREKTRAESEEADVAFKKQAGDALAQGLTTDQKLREAWRERQRRKTG